MLDFNVDINDLASEFTLSTQQVDELIEFCVEEVTTEVARQWSTEVKQNLGSARSQYLNALSVEKVSRNSRVVFLHPGAWLPNAIEQGQGSYDMKEGFLKSSKVKHTKKGKPYLTIPFRFATPDTLGENEAFSGILPRVIHTAVLKNDRQTTKPSSGLGLSSIPRQFQIPKSAALRKRMKSVGYEKLSKDVEMTSVYEGVTKSGSGYINFRRVSLASDSASWIHPGFTARNFADKASQKVEPIIPEIVDSAIDEFLSNLGY